MVVVLLSTYSTCWFLKEHFWIDIYIQLISPTTINRIYLSIYLTQPMKLKHLIHWEKRNRNSFRFNTFPLLWIKEKYRMFTAIFASRPYEIYPRLSLTQKFSSSRAMRTYSFCFRFFFDVLPRIRLLRIAPFYARFPSVNARDRNFRMRDAQ